MILTTKTMCKENTSIPKWLEKTCRCSNTLVLTNILCLVYIESNSNSFLKLYSIFATYSAQLKNHVRPRSMVKLYNMTEKASRKTHILYDYIGYALMPLCIRQNISKFPETIIRTFASRYFGWELVQNSTDSCLWQ